MQVYQSRVGNRPIEVGYYLTGKKDAKLDSTTTIDGLNIFEAAQQSNMAVVATFLLGGLDPNVMEKEGSRATPLHYAARSGDLLLVRFLLDNGAHYDATTASGETPLMWALAGNHAEVCMSLIDRGANVNHCDDRGVSVAFSGATSPAALHCVAARGIKLEEQIQEDTKQTLLHAAAKQGNMVKSSWAALLYLCENSKIDVNAQDVSGRTALHYACEAKDLNGVKALMLKGARNNITDNEGKIPTAVPKCTSVIKSFASKFAAEKSTSKQEKLALPDYTNWSSLDGKQLKHFLVAFFVPNTAVVIGAFLPTWIGIFSLIVLGAGFVTVAKFSMGQKRRSMATAGWFSGALCYGSAVMLYVVFPKYKACHENHIFVYLWWATTIPMTYCYVRACLADPGVIPSHAEGRAEIYEAIANGGEGEIQRQGFDMCTMVKKPLRSKHCSKTGHCVARFDHFCVWTGNAIGGGNHRAFVLYCAFQAMAQTFVAHCCISYMFYCTPSLVGPGQKAPEGFIEWVEWMYLDSEHSLVTFFCLKYNSFVLLFVSTVVFAQMWYATRNVTSNEVWFPERYKWMFRLGTRAYSLYDNGMFNNLKGFFFTDDLCAVSYTVPPMNEHLKKISRKYAAQMKARQESENARAAARGEAPQSIEQLEAGMYGSHGHDHGHSHGGHACNHDHGHSHGGGGYGGGGGFDDGFDVANAMASLPEEKQNELAQVQVLLQHLIAGQEPSRPAGVDDTRYEALLSQAKSMYSHYQAAMSNMSGGGGFGAPTAEAPPAATSPTSHGPGAVRRKAD